MLEMQDLTQWPEIGAPKVDITLEDDLTVYDDLAVARDTVQLDKNGEVTVVKEAMPERIIPKGETVTLKVFNDFGIVMYDGKIVGRY